jgi:hypothetical protein
VTSGTPQVQDYRLFGLRVRSEIRLPELFPAEGPGAPDIAIHLGTIGGAPGAFGIEKDGDALTLTIPDIARYRVRGGNEILIDLCKGAPERNVRLYLLGSAFGALLHQRGSLPLHANAVEINGHAVAFMGASGAGKSTLAAWFHDHGHKVIADDICLVGFDDQNTPHVAPGLPRLRLWKEALEVMGRSTSGLKRSYVSDKFDKFDVPIAAHTAQSSDTVLDAVYVLDRADAFSVTRLSALEAAEAVFANTYRGAYLDQVDGHQAHWAAATELVRSVPIFRLSRIWSTDVIHEQCERIRDAVSGD